MHHGENHSRWVPPHLACDIDPVESFILQYLQDAPLIEHLCFPCAVQGCVQLPPVLLLVWKKHDVECLLAVNPGVEECHVHVGQAEELLLNFDSNQIWTCIASISPGVLSNRALCLCPFCVTFSEPNSSFQMESSTKSRIVNAVLSGCLTSTPCRSPGRLTVQKHLEPVVHPASAGKH